MLKKFLQTSVLLSCKSTSPSEAPQVRTTCNLTCEKEARQETGRKTSSRAAALYLVGFALLTFRSEQGECGTLVVPDNFVDTKWTMCHVTVGRAKTVDSVSSAGARDSILLEEADKAKPLSQGDYNISLAYFEQARMKSTSSATWLGAEAKAYPYLGVRLYCVNHENNETLTIHGAADVKALSESSGKISVYDLIKQAKWIVKKTDKGTYDIDSYYEKNPQPK